MNQKNITYAEYKEFFYFIKRIEKYNYNAYVYKLDKLNLKGFTTKVNAIDGIIKNIESYIENCRNCLVSCAKPVPDGHKLYMEKRLWDHNAYLLRSNETINLKNAFSKFGHGEMFKKLLSGLILYLGDAGFEIDFSKFILRKCKIMPGLRIFYLPELPHGHVIRAQYNNILSHFFVDYNRNLGLAMIEYDVEKIHYDKWYAFEYLINGKVVHDFGIKIKRSGLFDICEVRSFGYPNFDERFSVFSSIIDDFYAVKSFMDGFYHRMSPSYFEKVKFYISFLLRYIIENDPDDDEIESLIDISNVRDFKVFLGNMNIIYEDILSRSKNIKSCDDISDTYLEHKILFIDLCFSRGECSDDEKIDRVIGEIANKKYIVKEEFDVILECFRRKDFKCVGLKDKKNFKNKDDVYILTSQLAWNYIAKNDKRLSPFCFIAILKIEGLTDSKIYERLINNEEFLGRNFFDLFGVDSRQNEPDKGGKVIARLWSKVSDIAKENRLPIPCIPSLLE